MVKIFISHFYSHLWHFKSNDVLQVEKDLGPLEVNYYIKKWKIEHMKFPLKVIFLFHDFVKLLFLFVL